MKGLRLQLHGLLQQYILQRGWSSRSCTTMNRIGKSPVPVSSSVAATMVATTSRNHNHPPQLQSQRTDVGTDGGNGNLVGSNMSPPSPSPSPTPSAPPLIQQPPVYDDELPINAINTASLPYFRNFYKGNCAAAAAATTTNGNNFISNPNFQKSVSTWGPLHKPLHWKVRLLLYALAARSCRTTSSCTLYIYIYILVSLFYAPAIIGHC